MSIEIKQTGINEYQVEGETVKSLRAAQEIARAFARDLGSLTGMKCFVCLDLW